MPYRRAKTNCWWISYYDTSGKQVRRSAETSNYAEAKALEQRLRAEAHAARQRSLPNGRGATFDTVLAEYLTPRISPRTRSTARHLASAFAGMPITEITPQGVRAYIAGRSSAAPATVNKELVMLSAAINEYNANHGTKFENPVRGLKQREPEGRLRWLTKDEYQHLLSCSSDLVRDFVRLACNTGMRKGEILGLTWDRVDFDRRLILLEAEHTKARRRRSVPLNDEAMRALSSRRAVSDGLLVFGIGDLKKGFAAACRRAGLIGVSPHTCRHTFASWLVMAGVSLYEVRDLLGHSTIKLTERYSHLAPENLRAAVARL